MFTYKIPTGSYRILHFPTVDLLVLGTYNFDLKCWNIIDDRSSNFQSSHADKMLNKFNYNFALNDNVEKTIDQIMNYLKIIKH